MLDLLEDIAANEPKHSEDTGSREAPWADTGLCLGLRAGGPGASQPHHRGGVVVLPPCLSGFPSQSGRSRPCPARWAQACAGGSALGRADQRPPPTNIKASINGGRVRPSCRAQIRIEISLGKWICV